MIDERCESEDRTLLIYLFLSTFVQPYRAYLRKHQPTRIAHPYSLAMSEIFVNIAMVVVVIRHPFNLQCGAIPRTMQLTNHTPGIWNRAVVRIEYETHTERTMKIQNQNPETLSLGMW